MADPMAKMSEDTDEVDADSETKSIAAALIKLSTMLQVPGLAAHAPLASVSHLPAQLVRAVSCLDSPWHP